MEKKFTILCIALLFGAALNSFGQPDSPGGGVDPNIPIDGGVGFAIAAGAAYGLKKFRDFRKKD